jgi:hypothetical protein
MLERISVLLGSVCYSCQPLIKMLICRHILGKSTNCNRSEAVNVRVFPTCTFPVYNQIMSAIATAAPSITEWTGQVAVTSQRASPQQVKLVRRFLSVRAFRHLCCLHFYVTERLSFWSSGSREKYCCHSSTSFNIPEAMFHLRNVFVSYNIQNT